MARAAAPSTIFIDEIDALCTSRGGAGEHEASRRVKSELLVQIDGVTNASNAGDAGRQVMLLAATNFPWDLDEALRRRLEKRIYIPLPDVFARQDLIRLSLAGVQVAPGVALDDVARRTEGYSGDDLTNICRDASACSGVLWLCGVPARADLCSLLLFARVAGSGMNGMRRMIAGKTPAMIKAMRKEEVNLPVTSTDLEAALARISPSVAPGDIERHERWLADFGSS